MNIKFTYVRDTPPPQPDPPKRDRHGKVIKLLSARVVTIARVVDHDRVYFAAVVNKLIPKKETAIDPRLRQVMEPQAFRQLQKRFRRRFGGDVHCKRAARAILIERVKAGRTYSIPYRDGHVVEDILRFISHDRNNDAIPTTVANVCYKAMRRMEETEQQEGRRPSAWAQASRTFKRPW